MNYLLLADELKPGSDTRIRDIYDAVVRDMPWGGLGMMMVLIALTLIGVIWIVWCQRRLAINQVKTAQLLQRHLDEHEAHKTGQGKSG